MHAGQRRAPAGTAWRSVRRRGGLVALARHARQPRVRNGSCWPTSVVNFARRQLGFGHWSLARFLKYKVKNAVNYISRFEHIVADEARRCDVERRRLRAHSPAGDHRRLARWRLPQLRRLGGKLHGAGRARGRQHAAAGMERTRGDGRGAAGAGRVNGAADRHRHRRVAPAGERGRAYAGDDRASCLEQAGYERPLRHARGLSHGPVPDLSGDPAGAVAAAHASPAMLDEFQPHAVHIATEGPLGHAARAFVRRPRPALHDLVSHPVSRVHPAARPRADRVVLRLPAPLSRRRGAHHGADGVSASAPGGARLRQAVPVGARRRHRSVFHPGDPISLRAAAARSTSTWAAWRWEKNIEAFLDLELAGSKVVIGDGPDFDRLSARYGNAHFLGAKFGRELARHLAGGDVFVFPSRTDTFGLVLLEAMACGLPVAAYPVQGPVDVVLDGVSGVLDEDLATAMQRCAAASIAANAVDYAAAYAWEKCTATFASQLEFNERAEAA